jgi:hypothetical protein
MGPLAGNSDTLASLVPNLAERKLYVFKAERLSIGEIGFGEERLLAQDASNLPRVLHALTTNPSMFDRYNRHVNQIFPQIQRVAIFPKGNNLEIRLWTIDLRSERDDLAIPLTESGTGVSQALAILYVAMTIEGGVIVIDEPNTFLHPGAAKTLIEILKQYNHQYIVSTHSPEVISSADPKALFVVKWAEGASSVQRVEREDAMHQRDVLAEIGVSASDVFGMDQIIWVEGQTEEECFPIIAQRAKGVIPTGVDFIAVRSVDEIVRKQGTDQVILEIYQRLSSNTALLPNALNFSFDRETRSDEYIAKVLNDSKGRVRFLPARHYECFLLNINAIQAVLAKEAEALNANAPSHDDLKTWFASEAPRFASKEKWSGHILPPWQMSVDAAKLLAALFRDTLKIEYAKTKHSRALTDWLLDNEPERLKELSDYVASLLEA